MVPILAGALCATLVLHFLGFTMLNFFGAGLRLFPTIREILDDSDRPIAVTPVDDEPEVPTLKPPPPEDPVEITPIEDLPVPDFDDLPIEELTIAPGETNIGLNNDDDGALEQLAPELGAINMEKVKQGLAEPAYTEMMTMTDNPIKVKSMAQPSEIDPDKWYTDKLKGAGGQDDSNLPDGSKTLSDLLSMPANSLGKGSGYSRLGADLLFEYNKATLKNSARIGMLQLAALIYKNPQTSFIIEGHTDSFGTEQYNTLLSLMRANAVREWLKSNGVNLDRVYIRACGASSPVVPIEGDKNKQSANRRVEIHMRKRGEKLPTGSLPSTYEVDMVTPIAKQLAANPELPQVDKTVAPKPAPPKDQPAGAKEEEIPVATPVEDDIPVAIPVE